MHIKCFKRRFAKTHIAFDVDLHLLYYIFAMSDKDKNLIYITQRKAK